MCGDNLTCFEIKSLFRSLNYYIYSIYRYCRLRITSVVEHTTMLAFETIFFFCRKKATRCH